MALHCFVKVIVRSKDNNDKAITNLVSDKSRFADRLRNFIPLNEEIFFTIY